VSAPAVIELSRSPRPERTRADEAALRLRRRRGGGTLLGLAFRLRPGSKLRARLLRHVVERTIAALNREDWDVFTANFSSDVEYIPPRLGGAAAWAGADDVYVGHDEVRRFHLAWAEDWGRMEHSPVELHDLGERLVFLAEMHAEGRTSGASLSQRYACVNDVDPRRALTTRVRFFLDWDEALRAAGEPRRRP
jgi:ketosteroid isomerase-like protein